MRDVRVRAGTAALVGDDAWLSADDNWTTKVVVPYDEQWDIPSATADRSRTELQDGRLAEPVLEYTPSASHWPSSMVVSNRDKLHVSLLMTRLSFYCCISPCSIERITGPRDPSAAAQLVQLVVVLPPGPRA